MGRDIAQALSNLWGKPVVRNGLAQDVGAYTVIGAQGHLFSLVDAAEYGSEFDFPWKIEPLPVLPDLFKLEPNLPKVNGKVVNNDLAKSIRARLSAIKDLIRNADEVIHAGDPDREGELIVNDILREFNYRGPVKRLWLHAQTQDGIQDAWSKMTDGSNYANLGLAALARRESDWAIGINATRAYTSLWWRKGNKGVLNIGRVVTPVVGMLVHRENEINNFVPIDHHSLEAHIKVDGHDTFPASWVRPVGEGIAGCDPSGKYLIDVRIAQAAMKKCQGQPAQVDQADRVQKKEQQPLLFSLTELQKAAAKMGYAPDAVLAAAQALYEKHKLTSYPRTECQYAPETEHPKAAKVIGSIQANFSGVWNTPAGWDAAMKSRAWDDKKLAEHFAIIPLSTSCQVDQLTKCERDVYYLICRQYLAQFFPDHEYLATTLVVTVAGEKFKATGRTPKKPGWRVLFPTASSQQAVTELPMVSVGDIGIAEKVTLQSKQTRPPEYFNAISLLEAMEKAHLFVTDPKVRAKLKDVEGIGTAATRAATIAKIVKSEFATESKTGKVITYRPTAKAISYIQVLPSTLSKPDLTAWFEGKLESIKDGSLTYAEYRKLLDRLVHHTIASAKDGSALQSIPTPDKTPQSPPSPPAKKTVKRPRAKKVKP